MSVDKILDAATAAFRQKFHDLCDQLSISGDIGLSPRHMSRLTTVLLGAAASAGQAGLKEYLAQHDRQVSSLPAGGKRFRFKNRMNKTFLTLFGEVTVKRCIYGTDQKGDRYLAPLDRALGLEPDDYATLETRDVILYAAAHNTPQEVEWLMRKMGMCQPSRTAIQNIIAKDGAAIEQHRETLREATLQKQHLPTEATILVKSMDGTNVRLREPGAKKGRKAERPRDVATNDQPVSAFRNATVGALSWYTTNDHMQAERLGSTYLARMPQENATTFKREFEATSSRLLQSREPDQALEKIFLADGARSIWKYVESTALYSDYHCLLDFYHATEHLSKAAEAIHGKSTSIANHYFSKYRQRLKTDPSAPVAIIRSLEGYAKRLKLSKARAEALRAEITFFKNNKRFMKYAEFTAKGWPIGSGPVEAAGKTIVKQRMCRSGMRWSRDKGQHILSLRAYVKSQTWDETWNAYVDLKMAG